MEKLASALTTISYLLPEVALSADLYHTDTMQRAVESIYKEIMTFFIQVAKCYKRHGITRLFAAIVKPFQLEYRSTLEMIRQSSVIIERISAGQSRTELRSISTAIHSIQAKLEQMGSQIEGVTKAQACQMTIIRGIQVSVQDIQPRIHGLQYGDIVTALKPSNEPAEMLYTNQSLIQRRQSKLGPSYSVSSHIVNLNHWAKSPASSLLVLQPHAGADFAAKEISVDIINHLRAANKRVFWSLSALTDNQPVTSTETILKTLLFQVTKATVPETLLSGSSSSSQGLTVVNASASHSEREWLEILKRSIARLAAGDCCFIVVECADLYRAHAGQEQWAQAFLVLFHALADGVQSTGSRVKVLVVNSDKSGAGWRKRTGESPRTVAPVRRSAPLPPKARKTWMRTIGRRQYTRARSDGWG